VIGMMRAQRRSYGGIGSIFFPVSVMMEIFSAEKREKLAGIFGLKEYRPVGVSMGLTKHY
jgi:hypothetical protein